MALIFLVVYVPFFNEIFNTLPLGWMQWLEILPLIAIPSIVAEVSKIFLGRMRKQVG
jgi:hypothetical protein